MKMKRLFLLFLAALALCASGHASQNYPEPCGGKLSGTNQGSKLCQSLIEEWGFEEASDTSRYGAFGSALLEPDGANVGNVAEIKALDGTLSLHLNGTSDYLWQLGNLPTGASTIAMWFRANSLPATVGNKATLVTSQAATGGTGNLFGPKVYLETTNAVGPKAKICYTNAEQETWVSQVVCSANDSILVNTVYHVSTGESPFFAGKSRLYLALDGGAMSFTTLAYYTMQGAGVTFVGAAHGGIATGAFTEYCACDIDQLTLYGRAFDAADNNIIVWGGLGLAYPFSTE